MKDETRYKMAMPQPNNPERDKMFVDVGSMTYTQTKKEIMERIKKTHNPGICTCCDNFIKINELEADKVREDTLREVREAVENKRKVKSSLCADCGGDGTAVNCCGGSDWKEKDSYNQALSDVLSLINKQ